MKHVTWTMRRDEIAVEHCRKTRYINVTSYCCVCWLYYSLMIIMHFKVLIRVILKMNEWKKSFKPKLYCYLYCRHSFRVVHYAINFCCSLYSKRQVSVHIPPLTGGIHRLNLWLVDLYYLHIYINSYDVVILAKSPIF